MTALIPAHRAPVLAFSVGVGRWCRAPCAPARPRGCGCRAACPQICSRGCCGWLPAASSVPAPLVPSPAHTPEGVTGVKGVQPRPPGTERGGRLGALTAWMPSSALAEQPEPAPEAACFRCPVFPEPSRVRAGPEPLVLSCAHLEPRLLPARCVPLRGL